MHVLSSANEKYDCLHSFALLKTPAAILVFVLEAFENSTLSFFENHENRRTARRSDSPKWTKMEKYQSGKSTKPDELRMF
jgi:hypothetical protein